MSEKRQLVLFEDSETANKKEKELGATDEDLCEMAEITKGERPNREAVDITVDSFAMVTGNLEDRNLKLKVVSVFDLSTAHTLPPADLLEHEIDVWRSKLLDSIGNNDEMLSKAIFLLVR